MCSSSTPATSTPSLSLSLHSLSPGSQGSDFFDSLLQKLQGTYQFKLEEYMDGMAVRSKPLRKAVSPG